ncbi:MAG: hypothetical protein ACPHCI_06705 [Solirubrobacterales bacterium]
MQSLQNLSLRLSAIAIDRAHRAGDIARDQRGQATVEYVGLTVVLGTGIGLIVTGLDGLGFATKIGSKLIGGITKALGKIA